MIQKVDFLGLFVNDLDKATSFYSGTLGLKVNSGESIPNAYTQFETEGDTTLALMAAPKEGGYAQSFEPGLMVQDIDAAYAEWQESGVELLHAPENLPFGRTFLFRTPEGHVLRAYQPHAS